MGWCSATEIMDAAVGAADALLQCRLGDEPPDEMERAATDELLRPFIARIADQLRNADWDCIEEAADFHRFRQEMLGYDDRRMAQWYREMLEDETDPDRVREYAAHLADLMEASNGR